jgi:hypothetical protein
MDFLSLRVGQAVEFRERKDQVNGTHAEQMMLAPQLPGTTK